MPDQSLDSYLTDLYLNFMSMPEPVSRLQFHGDRCGGESRANCSSRHQWGSVPMGQRQVGTRRLNSCSWNRRSGSGPVIGTNVGFLIVKSSQGETVPVKNSSKIII
jgi:hypothetical protein